MSSDQASIEEFVTAKEIHDDVNVPAWTPKEDDSMDKSKCQNCGGTVTLQFRRVFGNNNDVVDGCPECSTYREIKNGCPYDSSG